MTLPSGSFTLLGAVIAGGLLFWAIQGKKKTSAVSKASEKDNDGRPGTVVNSGEKDV